MPQHSKNKGRAPLSRDVQVSKALSTLLRHAAEKEGLKMDSQGYANLADVLAWNRLKSLKATFSEVIDSVANNEKKRFALLHIPSAKAALSSDASTPATTESTSHTTSEEASSSISDSAVPTTNAGQETATQTALEAARSDTTPAHFLIRATQGHSMKSVEAAAFLEKLTLEDESKLPTTVVHGTFHPAWPAILASGGLRSMGRNQIHFASGPSLDEALAQLTSANNQPRTEGSGVISGMRRDAQVLIYIDLRRALAAGCPFWRSENGVILSEGMAQGDGEAMTVPVEFFDVVVERKRGLGKIWEAGQVIQDLPAELTQKGHPKGKRMGSERGRTKG
ncbi:KptA family-domain-containing protein [Aspergillus ambiguus]|uniref:tRNA 2'-phosphotransferase n=1 Tax=Aspergillus ambiguus TaxID=176160 RepID=UPI003CCDB7A9